ncbi:MAG: AAA family ATPase [Actinobacteria bacterium]|nr:AAA family ATPase [Actinomycetota bacterium]
MRLLPTAPPAELRESNTSRVLLHGDRAYKVKKPVRFAFLDQRAPERRRELCDDELRLNRELAPDLYLAVRALVPAGDDGRLRLADADDPAAVDYAVEMRRFDEHATLAAHARAGTLTDDQLVAVAERVAAFHATARVVPAPAGPPPAAPAGPPPAAPAGPPPAAPAGPPPAAPAGPPPAVPVGPALAAALARLDRNAEQLLALLAAPADRTRVAAGWRCAAAFATGRADQLAARAAAGRVRELHGDLRAEHVLPGPPVRIVDRLEFDRALREVDTGDEVAFLAMDLTALGRPDAARRFVAAYRAAGGDPGDDELVAWHMLHRALVRAKVALLTGPATPAPDPLSPTAALPAATTAAASPATTVPPAAYALLALAERCAWRLRLPPVLVVCGPAASGKSTLAAELARRSGRPAIAADVVRKRLAGLAPTERARPEHYTPEMSRRTYGELGLLAVAAARRDGAIVDATFRHRADRDAFRAALATVAGSPRTDAPDVCYVECLAPPAVLAARAVGRLGDPQRISDATAPLALDQQQRWQPLDEVPAERHHRLRTDRPASAIADALAAALDGALAS